MNIPNILWFDWFIVLLFISINVKRKLFEFEWEVGKLNIIDLDCVAIRGTRPPPHLCFTVDFWLFIYSFLHFSFGVYLFVCCLVHNAREVPDSSYHAFATLIHTGPSADMVKPLNNQQGELSWFEQHSWRVQALTCSTIHSLVMYFFSPTM